MKEKKIEIKYPNILLVEGKDEYNFFESYFKYLKIDNVQYIDIGGKEKFKDKYESLVNSPEFSKIKKLGFIRDAEDGDASSAFQSIKNIIEEINREKSLALAIPIPVPRGPGEIISDGENYTGIFIMPNNNDSGMIEILCLKSIESDPIYKCIDDFIKCSYNKLSEKDKAEFKELKGRVLAFLATKAIGKNYVNSLGVAALKNLWDFSNPCFDMLNNFVSKLF